MSNPGRGRGESAKIAKMEASEAEYQGVRRPGSSVPMLDVEEGSSGSSSDNGGNGGPGPTVRGRGGYRAQELKTIPAGITQVKAPSTASGQSIEILTNFVRVTPMERRAISSYRVDFEPNLESVTLRVRLFREVTRDTLGSKCMFDGMNDARSPASLPGDQKEFHIDNPQDPGSKVTIKIKKVGNVSWGSFEMLRLYNMHMKNFLKALGFFSVSKTGAYVHEALSTPIGQNNTLVSVRGYKTAANVHQDHKILMNLESVHKLMQKQNVLRYLYEIRERSGGNVQAAAKAALSGKLVITRYNKVVYKIEDINFSMNPNSKFSDRRANKEISYLEYYQSRYNLTISDQKQPLLLVVANTLRQRGNEESTHEIYLVPELCNIAGLTDAQRNDNRLKMDLIRSSQIPPSDRVNHMMTFLSKLHGSNEISNSLKEWGYSYDKNPVKITGRICPKEKICFAKGSKSSPDTWPAVDNMASFDSILMRESVLKPAPFPKLAIVVGRTEIPNESKIISKLKTGFGKVGVNPGNVQFYRMQDGDSANHYSRELRNLSPDTTAAIVIMTNQNKERYDAIKKQAAVEKGLITQVITSRLMMDDRKAGGASVKIGVQLAAKVGGEPWTVFIPIKFAMVCGYDTYHDTTNRGRSFGAFVASMNDKFTKWYSKADSHERLDELSAHMTENLTASLRKYRELNGRYPDRCIIYRDGVGDGQLEHVYNVEVKDIKRAVEACDDSIRLTIIVVNKRIGARFYMKTSEGFQNPPPGTVIDDVVTRQERYDFYLISQSTRHGTVSPTYYNVLFDESGLDPGKIQMLSYKLCFMYFNWTGTVRVPAPCQYAHKLALLCGEHLHAIPNANIDDRLHFL